MIKYNPKPLPRVEKIPFSVNSWQGVNKIKGSEQSGEMVKTYNMSSDNIPFSSPRKSREVIASDITNPTNLFSANDKLGYIANGQLYYNKSENFESIGVVGKTSAITDFNGNIVMYPSNIVYDYVDDEFEAITTYLTKEAGSYVYNTGLASASADSVRFRTYGTGHFMATFRLAEEIITPNNESITINSNIVPKPQSNTYPYHTYRVGLYIVAFNSNNEIITHDSLNYYAVREFGSPISIANAAKLKVIVGYTKRDINDYISTDVAGRDADYARGDLKIWLSKTEYPASGSTPAIKYACVDNNRIVAVEGNNVYASSLGSYEKWTDFTDADGNPDPLGSYTEKLDTPQDIIGVVKYKNSVVILKPDLIYEAYGSKPPYQINEVAKTGCIDGRSIIEVNSILYWLGRKGIYSYTGGQPRIISQKLDKTFISGVAGTDGRKYYISTYDGTNHELYVYDTFTGLWHTEDDIQCVGFAYAQGHLHALTSDGKIHKFGSGTERVNWSFETQEYTFNTPNTKSIRKLFIRAEMQPFTNLDVYIKSNNGNYERAANYSARDYTMFDFKVRVKKCDSFSLKFAGRGDVRILDIHGDVTIGTNKHRSGDSLTVFRG